MERVFQLLRDLFHHSCLRLRGYLASHPAQLRGGLRLPESSIKAHALAKPPGAITNISKNGCNRLRLLSCRQSFLKHRNPEVRSMLKAISRQLREHTAKVIVPLGISAAILTGEALLLHHAQASDATEGSTVTLSRPTLIRLIRQELQRTGCLVDVGAAGWGKPERRAAEDFLTMTDKEAQTGKPTARLLMLLANAAENVCDKDASEGTSKCFTYDGAEYCD
ncbi:hypothetical protein OS190_11945 [Sulfitobacter sp. F26204]|uniref:hypothetical protein n=1 Tax=Sulfitobacter sp. F26204 TaxID=2996014 RepID=UPI00225E120D|nr:hypothetical protein [Sulfitobacter sp. F26204]MCX7560282.1 hypothetical protein [Sulfitobacter sp. F26204]